MSEPIPESIPTSSDRRSQRPTKRRALTPLSQQSAQVDALFANPDREINIPSGPQAKTLAAPPEIVANVQGSSAGAGSGEFHVYKASRRREYERLRLMDEENEKEQKDREFEERQEEMRKAEAEKLSKNQAKRAKAKARKEKAEQAKKSGRGESMEVDGGVAGANRVGNGIKKKLGAAKVAAHPGEDSSRDGNDTPDPTDGTDMAIEQEGTGITFHDDD